MTIGEYKAWLDGFKAGMDRPPKKSDLEKMVKKLEEVSDGCNHWQWCTTPTIMCPSPFYTVPNTNPPWDTITVGGDYGNNTTGTLTLTNDERTVNAAN